MRAFFVFLLAVLTPSLAMAHAGPSDTLTLAHGLAHPLGGIDHVLAMLGVGVLAAVAGGRGLVLVPLAFLSMMILGFLLSIGDFGLPFVELGIGISSVVIGVAAVWGRSLPLTAVMGLVGLFAVFHGHAHGMEMPAFATAATYGLGFMLSTALLHLLGAVGSLALVRLGTRAAPRLTQLLGGTLALGGVGVLLGWL